MSDDEGAFDGSDWLSNQFTPTEQVPKQDAPETVAPDVAAEKPTAPPPVEPPPVQQPPVQPVAVQPVAPVFPVSTPAPIERQTPAAQPVTPAAPSAPDAPIPTKNAAGGFDWGLRPASSVAAPPEAPAAQVPPLIEPPAPVPAPSPEPAPEPAPATSVGEPTQPFTWSDFAATQQPDARPASVAAPSTTSQEPTQAYTLPPWEAAAPVVATTLPDPEQPHDPTSAIDSLFAEHQFQPYEEVGVLQAVQAANPIAPGTETAEREPRAPLSGSQKALMGVAGGLIAVLILIGMFFLGEHLGKASAATPEATKKASTSVPTPAGTGGPAAPGVRQWSALQGGECITQFSSAWAQTFTVVDCTSDHTAEMVFKGTLPDPTSAAYPTSAQFQTELTPLCSAPTAINYSAASAVTDLEVSFSYPASSAEWIKGDRTYYCFVNRQSGGNIPGNLAVAKAASN